MGDDGGGKFLEQTVIDCGTIEILARRFLHRGQRGFKCGRRLRGRPRGIAMCRRGTGELEMGPRTIPRTTARRVERKCKRSPRGVYFARGKLRAPQQDPRRWTGRPFHGFGRVDPGSLRVALGERNIG